MSSSKGTVVDLPTILNVYTPELVRYLFAGTRPNTEFVISFDLDVIKIYEDYDKTERIAWGVDAAKSEDVFAREKRIYEFSQPHGMPARMPCQVPFRHLCNLLQIATATSTRSSPCWAILAKTSCRIPYPLRVCLVLDSRMCARGLPLPPAQGWREGRF